MPKMNFLRFTPVKKYASRLIPKEVMNYEGICVVSENSFWKGEKRVLFRKK
jgi:hypothetical protein